MSNPKPFHLTHQQHLFVFVFVFLNVTHQILNQFLHHLTDQRHLDQMQSCKVYCSDANVSVITFLFRFAEYQSASW